MYFKWTKAHIYLQVTTEVVPSLEGPKYFIQYFAGNLLPEKLILIIS